MFCTVYPLKHNGVRLPKEEARAEGMHGWLYVGKAGPNAPPEIHAWLMAAPGSPVGVHDLLPQLRHAQLVLVKGGGMLLKGHDSTCTYPTSQNWWVVPDT